MAFFMNNRHTGENRDRRGFTLAELLIVVAIIAVLTAIAIPIFSKELEKSREATDLSNVRAAYAEVMADAINGDFHSATVNLRQTQTGWQMGTDELAVGGVPYRAVGQWEGEPKKGGVCAVTCDPDTYLVKLDWGASGGTAESESEGGGSESGVQPININMSLEEVQALRSTRSVYKLSRDGTRVYQDFSYGGTARCTGSADGTLLKEDYSDKYYLLFGISELYRWDGYWKRLQ